MCVEPAGEEIESGTLEDEEEHEEVLTHVADRTDGAVPGGSYLISCMFRPCEVL